MFCQYCSLAQSNKNSVQRDQTELVSSRTFISTATTAGGEKSPLLEGISWTGNRHYFCFALHHWEVMAHKVFPWRMAGERKPPETQPSFYWVMDIFSKEPSRAALLKVTELTLSTDNINGIVDVSISSFIFFFVLLNLLFFFHASEAYEEWLKSTCRVSDVCCAARVQSIRYKWNFLKLI